MPERPANPADRKREASKVVLEDDVIGPRVGGTPQPSQSSCLVHIPTKTTREKPQTPSVSGLAGWGVLSVVYPPVKPFNLWGG